MISLTLTFLLWNLFVVAFPFLLLSVRKMLSIKVYLSYLLKMERANESVNVKDNFMSPSVTPVLVFLNKVYSEFLAAGVNLPAGPTAHSVTV